MTGEKNSFLSLRYGRIFQALAWAFEQLGQKRGQDTSGHKWSSIWAGRPGLAVCWVHLENMWGTVQDRQVH